MSHLSQYEVEDYVFGNKYLPRPGTEMHSRCIDGRYPNSPETPALAIPGADVGALALLYATAGSCGFEVNPDKAFRTLVEIIGDVKYFSFHTDQRNYRGSHGEYDPLHTGCGHIRCMGTENNNYSITNDDLDILGKQTNYARNNGAKEIVLQGDHKEGAVLQISGDWGVQPQGYYGSERGNIGAQVFIYHSGLVGRRNEKWSELLLAQGAVDLGNGFDEEYLSQMLSEKAEDHLMLTAQKLAKGLPLYNIPFDQSGNFKVEFLGNI